MCKLATAILAGSLLLTGCGLGTLPSVTPGSTGGGSLHVSGSVHGGQNPVSASSVQLWSVGSSGYGAGATSMLTNPVTSDAAGNFSITGDYSCTGNPLVYITATGGNSGTGSNSQLVLVAALGSCSTLSASSYIIINEVTTVATAYALSSFANVSTGVIGSSGLNTQGIINGFATAANLANFSTGAARATTPSGTGLIPTSEINTLADILAPCVNSVSSAASPSSACSSLFSTSNASGGASVNTFTAILAIANHPGNNVAALYALVNASAPFQPQLTSAPNDWTVAISFAAGGTSPRAVAIDFLGNVWLGNYNSGGSSSSVSFMTPTGVLAVNSPYSNSTLLNGVYGLAVDTSSRVWVVNHDNNSAEQLGYGFNGTNYFINTLSGPYNSINLSFPSAAAIDSTGNIWFTSGGTNALVELSPNGSNSNSNSSTGGGLVAPAGIAFDNNGHSWIADNSVPWISSFDAFGNPVSSSSGYSGGGLGRPYAIAIDSSNRVNVSDSSAAKFSQFANSGTPISSSSGYTGGGITASTGLAVDGAGNIWIADSSSTSNQISEFTSSGVPISPSTGYQGGNLAGPSAIAIDAAGNVWVANGGAVNTASTHTVTEFIGAAVPATTPLALAVQNHQVGVIPGTPIPVIVNSRTLPLYQASVAYIERVYASGGNSGSYTWTIASGALPSGLSLATSTGVISGTPSASGTASFSLRACDTNNLTNCNTQSFTLTSVNSLTAGGQEAALSGTYAVRFAGFRNTGGTPQQGAVYGSQFTASISFNGAGTISGGEADTLQAGNSASNYNSTLSGYYTVGADHRGLMVITSGSQPLVFAIAVENFTGSIAQTIHLIEVDDTQATTGGPGGTLGSGIGKRQTAAAFTASTLNQSFVFGLEGETPCTNFNNTNPSCPQTVAPFGTLSMAGRFVGNASNSITTGQLDAAAVGTPYTATLTGSYTAPDSFGRGTLTFTYTGTLFPVPPTHFTYYIVNAGEIFFMSTDGHVSTSMLRGSALAQSGSFSAATFNGNYVTFESAGMNGDGVSVFPTLVDAALYYLSANGAGSASAVSDENKGGFLKLNQNQGTLTYTVDSTGRTVLGGQGGGSPIFYLANSTAAFGTEQPSSSGDRPALLVAQQQAAITFSTASINGTYAFASLPPVVPISVTSGVFVSPGNGTATLSNDTVTNAGLIGSGTDTLTFTVASYGRIVSTSANGGTSVGFLISPTQAVLINTDSSTPSVLQVGK
jgi:hypothetical protein